MGVLLRVRLHGRTLLRTLQRRTLIAERLRAAMGGAQHKLDEFGPLGLGMLAGQAGDTESGDGIIRTVADEGAEGDDADNVLFP